MALPRGHARSAHGNRITATVDGNAQTLQYYKNASGGNLSLVKSDGTWNYKYDQNGNLVLKAKALLPSDPYNPGTGVWNTSCDTSQEYWSYSWDLNNRLVSAQHYAGGSTPTQTDSYVYDAAGLRVQRTGSDGSTIYMYSSGSLVYSKNTNTGLTRTIAYMGSTVLGWADTKTGTSGTVTAKYYAATDQLGSVTAITDVSGTVVWSSEYTPFGGLAGSRGTYDFSGLFTGKDIDADTGLYYFNARWYDAGLGRFINQDPAGQGMNWYSYGGSNPLTNIDPSGNDWGSFWSTLGVYSAAFASAFIPVVGPYISAAILGAYAGGTAVNGGNGNIGQWSNNAQTWEGMAIGALIGLATAGAGQATMGILGASGTGAATMAAYPLQTAAAGAVSGFVGGFLNSWAFGDMNDGFGRGRIDQDFEAGLFGGVAGLMGGMATGAFQHQQAMQAQFQEELNEDQSKQLFGDQGSFKLRGPAAVANGSSSGSSLLDQSVPKVINETGYEPLNSPDAGSLSGYKAYNASGPIDLLEPPDCEPLWPGSGSTYGPVGGGGGGTTRLYRAVSPTEFGSVMNSGQFSAGEGSMEGKWFAATAGNAASWGTKFYGDEPFNILGVTLPDNAVSQFFYIERLDGIGPAFYGELDQINVPGMVVEDVK